MPWYGIPRLVQRQLPYLPPLHHYISTRSRRGKRELTSISSAEESLVETDGGAFEAFDTLGILK